ncbi:uncharacterized protein BYT42DRAFT_476815, partial [Radiomyces spectabilis]|uniref:uncharacterized protein n=1 Tax=Radiomyces spectabilis TaxID=64574 RepID=UPI00221FFD3D
MDRTFQDYDQSLLDLEEQRRSMELLMKKMGQEWEISGAGIGWMGDISSTQANVPSVEARQELQTVITAAKLTAMSQQHTHNYCENTSPDFLQTLMNMNESLLNQSAAD